MSTLRTLINSKTCQIGVVGLGYVGLPCAVALAKQGFPVLGIDLNRDRVDKVNRGENYISINYEKELQDLVTQGKLRAVDNYDTINEMDIILICVPTGLTKTFDPDLQYVIHAANELAKKLRCGQLICLESTIFPGTTEDIVLPILERSGLLPERDFYLCHSPERIDPGNQKYTTEKITKIVGAIGPDSLKLAVHFYKTIIENVISVPNIKVAETTKIFENTFRAVNIGLVNEFALICDKMNICVWDVLDAAFTKPFGITPFYPGPGVGGHCIPVDPHYLEWKAKEFNYLMRFARIAGEINRKMPEHVKEVVVQNLNKIGIALSKSKVLIVGMAYKKDINDYRESPAISLADSLIRDGVDLLYHDPYIEQIQCANRQMISSPLTEEIVNSVDLVIIVTDHSVIDYHWLVKNANVIVDTRNATRKVAGREGKVVLL